jgi:hypothetical protein
MPPVGLTGKRWVTLRRWPRKAWRPCTTIPAAEDLVRYPRTDKNVGSEMKCADAAEGKKHATACIAAGPSGV